MAEPSRWRVLSRQTIAETLAALPADADYHARKKALREAYPFGPRQHLPYKMWCEEVRAALKGIEPKQPGIPKKANLTPEQREFWRDILAGARDVRMIYADWLEQSDLPQAALLADHHRWVVENRIDPMYISGNFRWYPERGEVLLTMPHEIPDRFFDHLTHRVYGGTPRCYAHYRTLWECWSDLERAYVKAREREEATC